MTSRPPRSAPPWHRSGTRREQVAGSVRVSRASIGAGARSAGAVVTTGGYPVLAAGTWFQSVAGALPLRAKAIASPKLIAAPVCVAAVQARDPQPARAASK